MSVGHYENFPVGSLALPRRMRKAVHAVYHFARYADDVADEGEMAAAERLAMLDELRLELDRVRDGVAPHMPMMARLGEAIAAHDLPLEPFYDLLSAFSQDVVKTRYQNFAELVDYCRRSANPVGRLMLAIFGETDSRRVAMSDGICTALQLINFLQDVAVDWKKGRVYLPAEDLARFRLTEADIGAGAASGRPSPMWTPMMLFQIDRARRMLQGGAPLGRQLPGRLGFELRMIILGGDRILSRLHESGGDVFASRPVLNWKDWLYMIRRALLAR
ncbi:squalene synthase HpnC [Paludibacterium paludis]|uniref:Squalene/phytoene synthase n=1 Tax=Paludibacterium paludis TaxID=1225769 RepID=A0A918P703_9NEIS|nr:squalene synthase HpnC [Paludibacterium paludis]GGY28396.1 squalene/phytoene synthase [Paludibacterium paludis]